MKISVLQENLHKALARLQKAIPSKPQLPILSSVLISVKELECTIAATDLYFGVKTNIQADSSESGTIVIPGKELREIVSSLPAGPLTLTFQDSTVTIQNETTTATLQCHSSDEYPPFPQVEVDSEEISIETLEKINSYVSFSSSTDQARPVLTSILLQTNKEQVTAVSTDGFRLSKLDLVGISLSQAENVLIPAQSLSEVCRIGKQIGAKKLKWAVSSELKQVLFTIEDTEVYVRMIEGEFPPYQKIIPTTFETEVFFNTQELVDNLKRSLIFARDASNIVRFSFKDQKVSLLATSPSIGKFVGELPIASVSGKDNEIAFNARYVLDYLAVIPSEEVTLKMLESLKPALFTSPEVLDHQYVVMPFKIHG